MTEASPQLIAADLAAGDLTARDFDWAGTRVVRVRSPLHPRFAPACQRLWAEFGSRGEMEQEEVIRTRLAWSPACPVNGHALLYEMLVVERGAEIIAVRDHTAIVPNARIAGAPEVIVHLSHMLIEPAWRGTGLSGWLRALPIQTGIEGARAAAGAACSPVVTLVAEMEHPDGVTPAVMGRLRSYERAGFLKIDPQRIHYAQPDFRTTGEIDRSAFQPVPLALVARRVGREAERAIGLAEAKRIVAALYVMYGVTMLARHMRPLSDWLDALSEIGEPVALVPPTL